MSAFSHLYDRKYLVRCLVSFALVFGLMNVTKGAGFAVAALFVFYGLMNRKTEMLFFWLLVAICAIIINPNVVVKGSIFAWTQRGLMVALGACMTIQVLAYPAHKVMKPFLGMFAYLFVAAISSLIGWCPAISFLKLVLFILIYCAYFGVANQIGINPRVSSRRIRSVMLAVAILFTVGSMALVPFPGLSQLRGEEVKNLTEYTSLFMGMTNHSQCLGPVVSSIAVVVFADLLFSIRKWDPLYLLILACCPYLIYKTSSRTGMGAFILGMMFVVYLFMLARGVGSRWKQKAMSALMLIGFALFVVAVSMPKFREGAAKFALKTAGEGAKVTKEGVISSRQGLIDKALWNFRKSPLLGNGFQVASDMKGMKVDGLVLSAPIEKGVWVTAVLEETGVVGWLVFVSFLTVAIFSSVRKKAYMGAACLFVCTLTNLGEFTFFSMSYTGGFTWAMVFVGLALDIRKMREENQEMKRQMLEAADFGR